jgi:hypothetical protein
MVIRTELVQSGSLKSDTRLDLGESELPLLPPPRYWLFRTNQTLRLVSWSTKRSISTRARARRHAAVKVCLGAAFRGSRHGGSRGVDG